MAVGFRRRDHPQEYIVDVAVELGGPGSAQIAFST
jgi:hypothetical protein